MTSLIRNRYGVASLLVERHAEVSVLPRAMGVNARTVFDAVTGRRRVCQASVFTACVSRHCFVWLSFTQTTAAVIEGFEAS